MVEPESGERVMSGARTERTRRGPRIGTGIVLILALLTILLIVFAILVHALSLDVGRH